MKVNHSFLRFVACCFFSLAVEADNKDRAPDTVLGIDIHQHSNDVIENAFVKFDVQYSFDTTVPDRNLVTQSNIGNDIFHSIGEFSGNDNDPFFGSGVAIDDDGQTIAFWGSFANLTSYVDILKTNPLKQSYWTQLGQRIVTGVDYLDRPIVDLSLSGDGKMLAVAVMYVHSSSSSGVQVYQLVDGHASTLWEMVGSNIAVGSLGHLPGLKVSLSRNGEILVIGARNFEHEDDIGSQDVGRAMVYSISSTDDWKLIGIVTGDATRDNLGASVSITGDGDYVAIGATGFDENGLDSGSVKVFHLYDSKNFGNNPDNFLVGATIKGEGIDDNSGFSVKLVKISSSLLKVAIGAIYNDGANNLKRNAGHVRVYAFDKAKSNPTWDQVGNDMDGDFGATLEYPLFHVGDSFGFSLGMSLNGNRVGIGAPFYSENRMAEYYSGNFKLYEFNSILDEWIQIASDIVGEEGGTYGWSIDLSGDGKTVVIGGPTDHLRGKVQVWYQDQVSNEPSLKPSDRPSWKPSDYPSFAPSSAPSVSLSLRPSSLPSKPPTSEPSPLPSLWPSLWPSELPTIQPSLKPSSPPSTQPTLAPSNWPTMKPSLLPSTFPTTKPSNVPSTTPSMHPTVHPSISPSNSPSISPSSAPTPFTGRAFRILSNFNGFAGLSNSNVSWCLQAKTRVPESLLFVRPCDYSGSEVKWKQLWNYDGMRIFLEKSDDLCIKDEAKQLKLQRCTPNEGNDFYLGSAMQTSDPRSIYVKKANSNKPFFFIVDNLKIFSRVRLSRKELVNASWNTWELSFEEPSPSPSSSSSSPSLTPPSTLIDSGVKCDSPFIGPNKECSGTGGSPEGVTFERKGDCAISGSNWVHCNNDDNRNSCLVSCEIHANSRGLEGCCDFNAHEVSDTYYAGNDGSKGCHFYPGADKNVGQSALSYQYGSVCRATGVISLSPSSQPTMGSCLGFHACFDSPGIEVSPGSCVGYRACNLSGGSIIKETSCRGQDSCLQSPRLEIQMSSCVGYLACQYGDNNIIGENSCNGHKPCEYRMKATIGDNSCNGFSSCSNGGKETFIGDGSCNETESCKNSGTSVTIGNSSCNNGHQACANLGDNVKIGNNSCNCPLCCENCKANSVLPDNVCNSAKELLNGECEYCL